MDGDQHEKRLEAHLFLRVAAPRATVRGYGWLRRTRSIAQPRYRGPRAGRPNRERQSGKWVFHYQNGNSPWVWASRPPSPRPPDLARRNDRFGRSKVVRIARLDLGRLQRASLRGPRSLRGRGAILIGRLHKKSPITGLMENAYGADDRFWKKDRKLVEIHGHPVGRVNLVSI